MKRKIAQLHRFTRRRGTMLVLVAAMIVVLMGMVALVVDTGYIAATRATLQAAADSAALAGAGAMTQHGVSSETKGVAVDYAFLNVPDHYGQVTDASQVTFGVWDPQTSTFTPDDVAPNAVKVVLQRTSGNDNPVPFFFGKVFGREDLDITCQAIAAGAAPDITAVGATSVYVTSTKDLSNVVLEFADGVHQKFEGLHGYTGTFQGTGANAGKEIVTVWIKSGCNSSSDGPGYGERINNPDDGTTIHGVAASGCRPHVTATFQATGAEFTESGSASPVRLVK